MVQATGLPADRGPLSSTRVSDAKTPPSAKQVEGAALPVIDASTSFRWGSTIFGSALVGAVVLMGLLFFLSNPAGWVVIAAAVSLLVCALLIYGFAGKDENATELEKPSNSPQPSSGFLDLSEAVETGSSPVGTILRKSHPLLVGAWKPPT